MERETIAITFNQGNQKFLSTSLKISEILEMINNREREEVKNLKRIRKKSYYKAGEDYINPHTITMTIKNSFLNKNSSEFTEGVLKISNIREFNDSKLVYGHYILAREMKASNLDTRLNVLLLVDEDSKIHEKNIGNSYIRLNESDRRIDLKEHILNVFKYDQEIDNNNYKESLFLAVAKAVITIDNIENKDEVNVLRNSIALYNKDYQDCNAEMIPMNRFYMSYLPLFKLFIKEDEKYSVEELEQIGENIAKNIIIPIHNEIYRKWKYLYRYGYILNYSTEIMYPKETYLNRSIGLNSMCTIIIECLNHVEFDSEKAIELFKYIIKMTNIEGFDWNVGGRFSGLSSEAGIKRLVQVIYNEKTISDMALELEKRKEMA